MMITSPIAPLMSPMAMLVSNWLEVAMYDADRGAGGAGARE